MRKAGQVGGVDLKIATGACAVTLLYANWQRLTNWQRQGVATKNLHK
jgi:hypothetical protein